LDIKSQALTRIKLIARRFRLEEPSYPTWVSPISSACQVVHRSAVGGGVGGVDQERSKVSPGKSGAPPARIGTAPTAPANQRFIGEISADGKTIEGRWERGIGDAGGEWEIDFPINYFRK